MSVVPFSNRPVDRVHSVVDLVPTYVDFAGKIAGTEFVPSGMRNRPEAILAALMSGAERGLGPMESLRSINIIEGRPSLSAEAMRALVLAAGHDITIVENTAVKATLVGRRLGSDKTSPPFTWTIERARRARLANRGPWQTYPEAMLLARASTDLCRAVFPDVIAGLASNEEASDQTAQDEAPPTTRRRSPAAPRPPAVPALASDPTTVEEPPAPAGGAVPGDGIPGGDRPTWGPTTADEPKVEERPEPIRAPLGDPPAGNVHDAGLARRIHAGIGEAFPNDDAGTQARYRHALCAVMTRRREGGPVLSSSLLDMEEQLALSLAVEQIKAGTATVTDEPDGSVMFRPGKGWVYTIRTDPLKVTTTRSGTPSDGGGDGDENDPSPPPPSDN